MPIMDCKQVSAFRNAGHFSRMINDLPNRYERIALAQKAAFLILMIFAFTCALEYSLETEYCRASLESFKESFRTGDEAEVIIKTIYIFPRWQPSRDTFRCKN